MNTFYNNILVSICNLIFVSIPNITRELYYFIYIIFLKTL